MAIRRYFIKYYNDTKRQWVLSTREVRCATPLKISCSSSSSSRAVSSPSASWLFPWSPLASRLLGSPADYHSASSLCAAYSLSKMCLNTSACICTPWGLCLRQTPFRPKGSLSPWLCHRAPNCHTTDGVSPICGIAGRTDLQSLVSWTWSPKFICSRCAVLSAFWGSSCLGFGISYYLAIL